jgi:hypothetical protein
LTTAELLVATRRWPEAYAYVSRGLRSGFEFYGVSRPAFTFLRAQAAEATGHRDEAIRDYRHIAGVWRFADPPLRQKADAARDGLRRLRAD